MSKTKTKATSTFHQTSSLPETQLAETQTGPVPKLTKKKQALFSSFVLNLIDSMILIQLCTVLYSITSIIRSSQAYSVH